MFLLYTTMERDKAKNNSLENVLLQYYVQEKFYELEEKIMRGVNSWK